MVAPSSARSGTAIVIGPPSGSRRGSSTLKPMARSSSDPPGDGERLRAVPRRHHGPEPARGAAGGDDQQVVRRAQRRVHVLLVLPRGDRALAGRTPFRAPDPRGVEHVLADVLLAPAGGGDRLPLLLGDPDRVVARPT